MVVDSCELFGRGPLRLTADDVQMVILPRIRIGMTTDGNVDKLANARTLLTLIYIQEGEPLSPLDWTPNTFQEDQSCNNHDSQYNIKSHSNNNIITSGHERNHRQRSHSSPRRRGAGRSRGAEGESLPNVCATRAACVTLLTHEHEKVQGDKAITGEGVGVEGSNTAATGDQHAEGENKSKLDKVKEALHLKK